MTPSDGAILTRTGQTGYTPPQPSTSDNRIPSEGTNGSSTFCPRPIRCDRHFRYPP